MYIVNGERIQNSVTYTMEEKPLYAKLVTAWWTKNENGLEGKIEPADYLPETPSLIKRVLLCVFYLGSLVSNR